MLLKNLLAFYQSPAESTDLFCELREFSQIFFGTFFEIRFARLAAEINFFALILGENIFVYWAAHNRTNRLFCCRGGRLGL
jgi:hypothetical protein